MSGHIAKLARAAGFEDSSFTKKIRARTKTGKAKGPRLGGFYKLSKHLKLAALLKLRGDGLANLEQTLDLASRHLYLAAVSLMKSVPGDSIPRN